jgi:hypothetical protein
MRGTQSMEMHLAFPPIMVACKGRIGVPNSRTVLVAILDGYLPDN